ncbi:MAG: nitrilase-related carbon-nitrogen hydrolase [Acidobacteriota bacterium]|nr:nitrilase-related carbon-nitrogen hydrolase [Acidobacteriota bacterium]
MRLALAQIRSTEDPDYNLRRALESMERARDEGADAVAFAEVVLNRFFPCRRGDASAAALAQTIPGPITDAVAAQAKKLGLVTIFNLYERDGDRYFDSSPVFDADGSLLGVTRMIHITDYPGFHEQDYYHPGDRGARVYQTAAGRVGVAICYDRHYPEYMRALGVAGAEWVAIPQAGTVGEWPEGLYEAEVQTAAFQNGYFAALVNRVGDEGELCFAGESFAVDPDGGFLGRAKSGEEDLLVVDLDLTRCSKSNARQLFWRHRRPELYGEWLGLGDPEE